MIPMIGLPRSMLRNPYWFNANTGERIAPDGNHHYLMFTHHPECLGLEHGDLNFRPSREENRELWEIAYTDTVISLGWTRVDVVGDGTVVVVAGRLDWAQIALGIIPEISAAPVSRLIIVVFPQALTSPAHVQRFDLTGQKLAQALKFGLDCGASAELIHARPPSKMASHSGLGRCPFGRAS